MFTIKGKKYRINLMKMHNAVFLGFIALVMALAGFGLWVFATMMVALFG